MSDVKAKFLGDCGWRNDLAGVRKAVEENHEIINTGKYSYGWTGLMGAAEYNHVDILNYLIANKADLDMQNKRGWTALHRAALYGRKEAVKILLYAGANWTIKNEDGKTALDYAEKEKKNDWQGVVKLIFVWAYKTHEQRQETIARTFDKLKEYEVTEEQREAGRQRVRERAEQARIKQEQKRKEAEQARIEAARERLDRIEIQQATGQKTLFGGVKYIPIQAHVNDDNKQLQLTETKSNTTNTIELSDIAFVGLDPAKAQDDKHMIIMMNDGSEMKFKSNDTRVWLDGFAAFGVSVLPRHEQQRRVREVQVAAAKVAEAKRVADEQARRRAEEEAEAKRAEEEEARRQAPLRRVTDGTTALSTACTDCVASCDQVLANARTSFDAIKSTKQALEQTIVDKRTAAMNEDFERAKQLKQDELTQRATIKQQLKNVELSPSQVNEIVAQHQQQQVNDLHAAVTNGQNMLAQLTAEKDKAMQEEEFDRCAELKPSIDSMTQALDDANTAIQKWENEVVPACTRIGDDITAIISEARTVGVLNVVSPSSASQPQQQSPSNNNNDNDEEKRTSTTTTTTSDEQAAATSTAIEALTQADIRTLNFVTSSFNEIRTVITKQQFNNIMDRDRLYVLSNDRLADVYIHLANVLTNLSFACRVIASGMVEIVSNATLTTAGAITKAVVEKVGKNIPILGIIVDLLCTGINAVHARDIKLMALHISSLWAPSCDTDALVSELCVRVCIARSTEILSQWPSPKKKSVFSQLRDNVQPTMNTMVDEPVANACNVMVKALIAYVCEHKMKNIRATADLEQLFNVMVVQSNTTTDWSSSHAPNTFNITPSTTSVPIASASSPAGAAPNGLHVTMQSIQPIKNGNNVVVSSPSASRDEVDALKALVKQQTNQLASLKAQLEKLQQQQSRDDEDEMHSGGGSDQLQVQASRQAASKRDDKKNSRHRDQQQLIEQLQLQVANLEIGLGTVGPTLVEHSERLDRQEQKQQ